MSKLLLAHPLTNRSLIKTKSNSINNNHAFPPGVQTRSLSCIAYLWYSFQSVRQQARQRRAQRLLQQSERNFQQTLWICTMTYCDATDGGILLAAFLLLFWVALLYSVSSDKSRGWLGVVGSIVTRLRFGTRPLLGYMKQRRCRRRRLKELRQSQQMHQLHQSSNSTLQQPMHARGSSKLPPGH